jgi:DNA polymerase III epsilon subunit-like protein
VEACEAFWNQDGKTAEHRCLIAHNAPFDKNFCHALWASVGKQFPVVCWLNTMQFVKEWAKKVGHPPKKFSLEEVLKFAKIKAIGEAHNAESDTRNTYMLFKKGMELGVDHLTSIKRYPHILPGQEKMSDTTEGKVENTIDETE